MIAANEKMIDEKLKEVEYHKRAINVELTELRDRATANGKLAANAVGMLVRCNQYNVASWCITESDLS